VKLWKTPLRMNSAWDTDGVTPAGRDSGVEANKANLSGQITEARE